MINEFNCHLRHITESQMKLLQKNQRARGCCAIRHIEEALGCASVSLTWGSDFKEQSTKCDYLHDGINQLIGITLMLQQNNLLLKVQEDYSGNDKYKYLLEYLEYLSDKLSFSSNIIHELTKEKEVGE